MAQHNAVSRLLCAIDTTDIDLAMALSKNLAGKVGGVKLGLEFYAAHGADGVRHVVADRHPLFLDLKLHDIPNTVAGAIRGAAALSPFLTTVHAAGGPAMLRGAMAAAVRSGDQNGGQRPKVVAVTVLTSFDDNDLALVGMQGPVQDQVLRLADLAQECGVDGVVCSAHEIRILRQRCGDDFLLVVPGIRPAWSTAHDQKRIITPSEAMHEGADYLVVGRPITQASNPVEATGRIIEEMAA
jgi:orotidine-5'-phosphate decarboxylase